MAVELSQLAQLCIGHRKVLTIGNVPRVVAETLNCIPGIVNLRHQEALHIFASHPNDMSIDDLMLLTFVVERGKYYRDPKRHDGMSVVYQSQENSKMYLLGLKRVGPGELWISTYHRTNPTKVRQRQSKWPVLCEHR